MAKRPLFIPDPTHCPFVKEVLLEFKWYSGFAKSQTQKSILALHDAARLHGIDPLLEISSKSMQRLGVNLSAFNLLLETEKKQRLSVECAFQGSKVFQHGGPYTDLYTVLSREAKRDIRLHNSGNVIRFSFFGEDFPTKPLTAFYDWLYIKALTQNTSLANQLLPYMGFTDIAFNPEKSLNCQARSAALYVALKEIGEIDNVVNDKEYYLHLLNDDDEYPRRIKEPLQLNLL